MYSTLTIIILVYLIVYSSFGLIYFLIRCKKRMQYLNKNPIWSIKGRKRKVVNFIVVFFLCMIFGGFLLVNSIGKKMKAIWQFRRAMKDINNTKHG